VASFARSWLLVEGETEFWVLPELARIAGHDFAIEGVACVEFAQCGLAPLIKLARELGIEWHLLTDGDTAGQTYARQALHFVRGEPPERRITALPQRDIEACFYQHGYAPVFQRLAGGRDDQTVIRRAIDRHSKPLLALELVLAAAAPTSAGVPPPLLGAIEACLALSRRM
jgi:putative ATP-dependent endonuclease of OLD family